jgi:choline-glycine betaine transporter
VRRLHLWVGVATLVAFVGTGAYMRIGLDGLHEMEPGARMLYRSRHIYLLAAGLLHIALGTYLSRAERSWRSGLQLAGSALLLVAPVLLFWAFVREPPAMNLNGTAGHFGVYALAAGTLAHALSSIGRAGSG